jgi:rRNA maturation protein Rpf1
LILITTSGRPTQRIRNFCNDLQRVIPNSVRVNRGKLSRTGITEKALEINTYGIIVVERWKGGPGDIKLYMPPFSEVFLTLYLKGVKLQDEVGRRVVVRKNLVVTVEKNLPASVKHLAELLSKFLRVQIYEELPIHTSPNASVHISLCRNDVRIAFTMPPITNDIGPILTVNPTINRTLGETAS